MNVGEWSRKLSEERERLARAWDEGWAAAWTPLSMHGLNDAPNPYRRDLPKRDDDPVEEG